MVRQAIPLQPMEVHNRAGIHMQPMDDSMPEQWRKIQIGSAFTLLKLYVTIQVLDLKLPLQLPFKWTQECNFINTINPYASIVFMQLSQGPYLLLYLFDNSHFGEIVRSFQILKNLLDFEKSCIYETTTLLGYASKFYNLTRNKARFLRNMYSVIIEVMKRMGSKYSISTDCQKELQKTSKLISMIDYEDVNGMDIGTLPKNIDSLNDYVASFMPAVTPIHKKGQKEDLGNYRPVSLSSVPDKVMEKIILGAIPWHLQDGYGVRPSQHRFKRGRSCLTNLNSFYDQVTHLVDEGKAVDVVYLDFSKAFDTLSHSILLEKLAAHGLDRSTLCSVKNWLEGRAQRVVLPWSSRRGEVRSKVGLDYLRGLLQPS
ncbi:hypothetical protein BTVI_83965 [Pitangus sulphuratus]|nr:hypothetical protein BTVI_83965 [Pitangus sulphuratus]